MECPTAPLPLCLAFGDVLPVKTGNAEGITVPDSSPNWNPAGGKAQEVAMFYLYVTKQILYS